MNWNIILHIFSLQKKTQIAALLHFTFRLLQIGNPIFSHQFCELRSCLQECNMDSNDHYLTKDEIHESLYDYYILYYTSLDIY